MSARWDNVVDSRTSLFSGAQPQFIQSEATSPFRFVGPYHSQEAGTFPSILDVNVYSAFSYYTDLNASLPYLRVNESSPFSLLRPPYAGIYNRSCIHFSTDQLTSCHVGLDAFLSGILNAPDISYVSSGLPAAIDTPNFATLSTLPAVMLPLDEVPSLLKCQWLNCTEVIAPRNSPLLREHIRIHFKEFHPAASDKTPTPKMCHWRGCICRTTRNGRCVEQLPGHGAHVQDVLTHIWRAHVKRATS
jgi:hypothetical protein